MENMNMADQMGSATVISRPDIEEITPEKNIDEQQMEFSSSIQDVMSAPIDMPPMMTTAAESMMAPQVVSEKKSASSGYPLNLTKAQVEALVAGVAAVIGVSAPVQEKLSELIPSFFNEMGRLSSTGMAVTVLIVAIAFYFLRKVVVKK
jgi:hypothetical protein